MEPLEIVVTGNVDGAKSSLQTVQAELGKTALAAQKSDSTIDTFGRTMARFGSNSSASIALLTGKIEALKAEMVNIKDISVLSQFNKEIQASEIQLAAMTNAGKTGFNDLGQAVQKMGNPLSHGYGLLRKLAYVLPGIGISGIVAFATEPIINYVEKLLDAGKGVDVLKANLDNLNDVMADANKKAGEQISTLKILYQTAIDVNLSMKDRLAAAKELQKSFPEYFGNIKTETILNGDAKKSYDELTTSIIANAKAKAAKDKIDELEAKRLDVEFQKQKIINATTNEKNAALSQEKDRLTSKPGSTVDPSLIPTIKEGFEGRGGVIFDINKRKSNALEKAEIDDKALQDQIDFLTKFASLPTLASVIEQGDKKDKAKKTNPFEISLKALEDNYKEAQSLLVQQYDANTTDAKKNTTAVNDLLLKAQQTFLEQKLALIKQYGKKEGEVDLEIAKNNKAIIANQLNFSFDQIASLPKVQNAPKINFVKATTEKIDPKPQYQLSDAIKANIKLQEKQLELFNQTSNFLNKDLGPAFDVLFTGILDGSSNAFKAFGDAIKQMLVQLAAAVLKAAAFAAILSLLPGSAEFGTIFTKSLGFSKGGQVKGFASGGVIDGPGTSTSDSILARLSKGEYIMNAATVSKFGSSFFDNLNSGMLPKFNRGGNIGSPQIVASQSAFDHYFHGEVAGDKLLLLHDRAVARRGRNG